MVPAAGMIWADYLAGRSVMISSGFAHHVSAICERRYHRMHPLNPRQMRMRLCWIICISKKLPLLDYQLEVLQLYYLLCVIQTDALG